MKSFGINRFKRSERSVSKFKLKEKGAAFHFLSHCWELSCGFLYRLMYRYSLKSVPEHLKRRAISNNLSFKNKASIIDIGSGTRSWLSRYSADVISLDKRRAKGLDLVADARFLPLRSDSVDYVVSSEVIEHIAKGTDRNLALDGMLRVAKKRLIIYCPLDNNKRFQARKYDVMLHSGLVRITGEAEKGSLSEHIHAGHPSPEELTIHEFNIKGTINAYILFICLALTYGLPIIGLPVSRFLYAFILRWFNAKEPYYAVVAVLNKASEEGGFD